MIDSIVFKKWKINNQLMDSIDFNSLAFFNEASSAGEAIIAKFIFKMAFYADIKRERPQNGSGV